MDRLTYTVDEVAVMLGVSRNAVYCAAARGDIPAKRVGRRWVIPRDQFHEFLNGRTRRAS